jgi:threonine synthase
MDEFIIRCLDCGKEERYAPLKLPCPACGSEWREARYDLSTVRRIWQDNLHARPFDLWRYHELLPLSKDPPTRRIGGTPLYPAPNLAGMLGLKKLFIKDERLNPTGSFKDRQAAVTVKALSEHGIKEAVVCSTGNVAIAFAAACARAGIRLWAFLTSLVPAEKMHEVAIYGTEIIKVTGTYDQAKQLAAQFALSRGLYLDRGARSLPGVESMKTIAFEIAEQLEWNAPDWYLQPVSGFDRSHACDRCDSNGRLFSDGNCLAAWAISSRTRACSNDVYHHAHHRRSGQDLYPAPRTYARRWWWNDDRGLGRSRISCAASVG